MQIDMLMCALSRQLYLGASRLLAFLLIELEMRAATGSRTSEHIFQLRRRPSGLL